MTAQEAIDIIQSIPLSIWDVMSKSEDEAIDMAFEALEKQAGIERALERLEEESNFFGGEAMGTLQKTYYCKGIEKAIEIVKEEVG